MYNCCYPYISVELHLSLDCVTVTVIITGTFVSTAETICGCRTFIICKVSSNLHYFICTIQSRIHKLEYVLSLSSYLPKFEAESQIRERISVPMH
jgi:hypothetical protein